MITLSLLSDINILTKQVTKLKSELKKKNEALETIAKRRGCNECAHRYYNSSEGYCNHEKDGCAGNWEYYQPINTYQQIAKKALE